MIASVPGVPGLENVTGQSAVVQGVPRPAVADPARGSVRIRVGTPRPMPPTQPNGDPCSLTLWGSDEWDR